MGFVAIGAGDPDYGTLAAFLVALTQEAGFHVREVKTVRGGFEVPDVVFAQLEPSPVPPEVPAVTSDEPKTPPPGWDDPLPEVDVEYDPADGKYYAELTFEAEVEQAVADAGDREVIRAWAKENGFDVAEKGRLKQTVIDTYRAVQAE